MIIREQLQHLKDNYTIGLSLFAVTGTGIGIAVGFNIGGIIFLGLMTAIGGGIIRDMILNIDPTVLRVEIYGSFAILLSVYIWSSHL